MKLLEDGTRRIPFLYALFGLLWILLTDRLLFSLSSEPEQLARWQTLKGWVFVVVSTLFIFLLVSQAERRQRKSRARQEQSERRFRNLFRQLRQVMDSVPEGVLLLDPEGKVLQANPQALAHLSLLAGATNGDTLRALGERRLDTLLTSPPPGRWHTVQSNDRIFNLLARPVEAGPVSQGWVMVLRDVTEERAVAEQMQRQARLAAIGQLAAGIAHDFNNIINVILLYAEWIERGTGVPEEAQQRLATIREQAHQAAALIEQILDFGRRALLARKPLDLAAFLKEQVALLRRALPENIELSLSTQVERCVVRVDETRMQQVLMNLALNARDAMPDGGELRIELAKLPVGDAEKAPLPGMAPGNWIRLSVADTGVGIAPELLDRVFDPFFTTKGPGEGTGLGLAQVHGIVGQHGGQITVASEVGIGTTFTIYLPAWDSSNLAEGQGWSEALVMGQGELLLVVEDEQALQQALAETLHLCHYEVLTATNGEEAQALLAEHGEQIDLVLSDVVMPKMGGVALFHTMRQQGWRMPVILLTGHPKDKQLPEVDAWLPKPVSPAQLAQTVRAVLENS